MAGRTGEVSRLEENRRLAGHTVSGLARLIGVSHATVSQIERGVMKPSKRFRERASKVLGVPEHILFPGMSLLVAFLAIVAAAMFEVDDRLVLGVDEAAKRAGFARDAFRQLVRSGKVPSIRVSGRRRVVPVRLLADAIAALAKEDASEP